MNTSQEMAKARWTRLDSRRSSVLRRARDAATLTIPSISPPAGSDENTILPTPYQSLGARGVNNLASKLLLTLFPSDSPFFRFSLEDDVAEALGAGKDEIEEALRRLENKLSKRIESSNLRLVLYNAIRHLVVTGNALIYLPDDGKNRMYRLSQYVVVRDPSGNLMEAIIKESIHADTLSEEIQMEAGLKNPENEQKSDEPAEVYTHIKREGDKIIWHQEINDIKITGSEGKTDYSKSPFLALRWTAVENEDYGRGLVEEYMGDLISLEGLSKAIISFSAIAARVIILEKPNSTLDTTKFTNADTGDVITGNIDDLGIFQLDKFADFQIAKGVIDDITIRLSHAFLLRSGTIRDAERVTAEEVRAQAQELEDVLGGVYTVQTQELQLPLVRRYMGIMKNEGDLPTLPQGVVDPMIITGFEALGRGHKLNRLRQFFQDQVSLFGPEVLKQYNPQAVGKRFATGQNVDIAELLRDPQEIAQEQQQAQAQTLAEKAVGPAAGAIAQSVTNNEE